MTKRIPQLSRKEYRDFHVERIVQAALDQWDGQHDIGTEVAVALAQDYSIHPDYVLPIIDLAMDIAQTKAQRTAPIRATEQC